MYVISILCRKFDAILLCLSQHPDLINSIYDFFVKFIFCIILNTKTLIQRLAFP